MVVALDPCVRNILCGLSSAVLGALTAVLQGYKATAQAELVTLRAQLLRADVLSFPANIVRNAANVALNTLQSQAQLIPLQLIAGCVDLGDLNVNISAQLDTVKSRLNDEIDELNRLLTLRSEINQGIEELEQFLDQLDAVILTIQECAGGG